MSVFYSYPYSLINESGNVVMNANLICPVLSESQYLALQNKLENISATTTKTGSYYFADASMYYFNILSTTGKIVEDTLTLSKLPVYLGITNSSYTERLKKFANSLFSVKDSYFSTDLVKLLTGNVSGSYNYSIQNGAGDIYETTQSVSLSSNGSFSSYISTIGAISYGTSGSFSYTYFYLNAPIYILIESNGVITKYAKMNMFGYLEFPPIVQGVRTISYYKTFPNLEDISKINKVIAHIMKGTPTSTDPTDTDPFTPGGSSGGNTGGSGTGGGDGSSGSGGGGGSFSGDSENVPDPSTRDDTSEGSASVVQTGLISLYSPTQAQLNDLASYLWSEAFSIDSFKKIFADPMDAILGLSIVPVEPSIASVRNVTIGNVNTDIIMRIVSSQYVQFDCGNIKLDEYWGAFLDYAPYTKVNIYLPYIGVRQLSTDDVMKKTINVKYNIDLLSGACVCFIKCDDQVLYQFTGSVSTQIPVTSVSYNNLYKACVDVLSSMYFGVAMGTSGGTDSLLPAVQGQTASATEEYIIPYAESYMSDSASVRAMMSMKPQVSRSGAVTSSAGQLAIQTPYLIVERPRQCVPKKQNSYTGYPSYQTKQVSSQSGYTTWATVHLDNLTATADEKNEIGMIMKNGVIL